MFDFNQEANKKPQEKTIKESTIIEDIKGENGVIHRITYVIYVGGTKKEKEEDIYET